MRLAAFFHPKARLWIAGRKKTFNQNLPRFAPTNKVIWFHCSSLGEFEQGRPLIETFKKKYPNYKIALTFFSPSGYTIRKNYNHADWIGYLPHDTLKNAKKFITLLHPSMVFFVKYEFWFNYIAILKQKKIPLFVVSGIFRKTHYFFKWYGNYFLNQLKSIDHFFVQNEQSEKLLKSYGISQVTTTGDTRYDRVIEVSEGSLSFPEIEDFIGSNKVFVAGSTWQKDEVLLTKLISESNSDFKFITAPHELKNVPHLARQFEGKAVKYSEISTTNNLSDKTVLIIDTIGMLSSIYQYASIAYIGGGFGTGIHNTLEPAVFGTPIIFGPNYHKFDEAVLLIEQGGAFSINSYKELVEKFHALASNEMHRKMAGEMSKHVVFSNAGATEKIMGHISSVL